MLVVLCTLLITGVIVRREFADRSLTPPGRPPRVPVRVEAWEELTRSGHRIGSPESPLTIVVFSDFECPACAQFANSVFPKLHAQYGDRLSLVYRHWPLPNHRLSYPAARASECAAQQGSFVAFHDVLYKQQAELGQKPFSAFAKESGVRDLEQFARCAADTARVASIEADIAAVQALGGLGTPTVVMNGWHVPGGADGTMLDSVARSLLPVRE